MRRHPSPRRVARRDEAADPLRRAAHVREDPQHRAGGARRRPGRATVVRAGARGRARRSPTTGPAARTLSAELAAEYERGRRRVAATGTRSCSGSTTLRVAVTAAAPIPVEVLQFFRSAGRAALGAATDSPSRPVPMTWDAGPGAAGHGGTGHPGHGAAPRRRRRGARPRRQHLPRLPRRSRAHRRGARRRRLAAHRRHRRRSTTTGYLRIVDRKKELIITAGGKNVSPANLEAALKAQPLIGQACVVGDGRALPRRAARPRSRRRPRVGRDATAPRGRRWRSSPTIRSCRPRSNARSRSPTSGSRTPSQIRRVHRAARRVAPRLRRAHADDEAQAARDRREVRDARSPSSTR